MCNIVCLYANISKMNHNNSLNVFYLLFVPLYIIYDNNNLIVFIDILEKYRKLCQL